MRKRYLVLIIVAILIISAVYYFSLPSSPPNILNQPQEQGNKNSFRFPWQTTQTTPNQSSGGGSEGGGGAGAGGTGGGAGIGGTGEETSTYIQKNHASIDSIPGGLKIFVSYYNNGIKSSLAYYAPFSLETDPDSPVCMLLASMVGNNTLKWTVDGQDCQFSVCEEFSYNRTETLYSDYGCLINMNEDHSVTLHFIPA